MLLHSSWYGLRGRTIVEAVLSKIVARAGVRRWFRTTTTTSGRAARRRATAEGIQSVLIRYRNAPAAAHAPDAAT